MKRITEKDFKELAGVHDLNCISVFIPTHTAGNESFRKEDSLLLKNQLKEIKNILSDRGIKETELSEFVKPIKNLVDDTEYWSYQSEGLAIFISNHLFKKYELPVKFEPYHYVSTEFYLKPLLSTFATNENFFLLTLEVDEVRLYKGSGSGLEEINIAEIVPSGLEDVVGSDYEQKSLQFKSQQEGHGHSIYYGHGEGKDENKTEINKYLREVDKGLMKLLKDEKDPLVIAGVDYLFSAYREINSFNNLCDRHISGNPKLMGLQSLHDRALDFLQPFFNRTKKDKMEAFREFQGTPRTGNSIDEIVPAAIHGKIDTLFMLKDQDVFGVYNPVNNKVEIQNGTGLAQVSLFNLAAKEAFLRGANVYLVEQEEMPDGFSTVDALYRY
ncbi:MAG: hypothetical protein Q8891_07805 [Bacteroidota bacterium]|nr:hypothetical protein [Bacteroidota bacterium]